MLTPVRSVCLLSGFASRFHSKACSAPLGFHRHLGTLIPVRAFRGGRSHTFLRLVGVLDPRKLPTDAAGVPQPTEKRREMGGRRFLEMSNSCLPRWLSLFFKYT